MSVAKVLELSSDSPNSFDDAIKKGISKASETISEIRGAWVKDQEVIIENGKIATYRVHMRVTFLVK
jgi:flavin-binding protein dodecin